MGTVSQCITRTLDSVTQTPDERHEAEYWAFVTRAEGARHSNACFFGRLIFPTASAKEQAEFDAWRLLLNSRCRHCQQETDYAHVVLLSPNWVVCSHCYMKDRVLHLGWRQFHCACALPLDDATSEVVALLVQIFLGEIVHVNYYLSLNEWRQRIELESLL